MAKERLSKLQKWILVECYEHRDKDFPKGIISRSTLIYIKGDRTKSFGVSISRSIWSLIDKGYVIGLSPISVSNMAMIYGMQGKSIEEFNKNFGKYKLKEKLSIHSIRGLNKAKIIILTEKGEKQAKELLMLNSDTGRNLTLRKGNKFNVAGKKHNRRNHLRQESKGRGRAEDI